LRRIPRAVYRRVHDFILYDIVPIPIVCWLGFQNWRKQTPITCSGGPAISLTSYSTRIRTVHLAIESIARGDLLPSRIILWLDDERAFRNPPAGIERLKKRGLEVRLCPNYGPHTKYFPYVDSEDSFSVPLVLADDDQLYPRYWLQSLWKEYNLNRNVVHCHWAVVMSIDERGIAPYSSWQQRAFTYPSALHFAHAVSGVIYPPALLQEIKKAGRAFLSCCPKADDVWLHVQALRAGFRVRQIRKKELQSLQVPFSQGIALARENNVEGNDRQMRQTYTEVDLRRLREERDGCAGRRSAGWRVPEDISSSFEDNDRSHRERQETRA
jgi:hypothetical protein